MSCKVLLITSNLGSVFEEHEIEQKWLSVFNEKIMTSDPDVIALHCQEIGGKDFEITMPKIFEFVKKLKTIPVLAQFDRVRLFMDTDFNNSDHFTALGSMYFIHSRLSSVKIWNFHCDEFQEVIGEVISCQTEGMCQQLSSNEYHRKERFPSEYYPEVKWSRKGFMHTKWKINGNNLNLVNVHLFHDEDNLVALEQSPSCYSQYRYRAMHHTLQRVCSANDPLFMFGDFNFRLDLTAVVKHVTTQYHQPQFIRGDSGSLEKVIYRNPLAMEEDSLCIERRKFYPNSHATLFIEGFTELLKYDCELSNIKEMKELPIKFQPSYPFSEDSTVSNRYMEKRCPAWCDRVLMNDLAMGLVQQSSIQPVYNLMGKDVCTGDHKPVYLLFELNLSKFDSTPANVSLTTGSQHQLQALNTAALAALQHLPVLISSLLPPTGGSSSVPLNSSSVSSTLGNPVIGPTQSLLKQNKMQYYHAAPPRPGDGTVYPSYPAPLHPAAAAAAARMQWSPGVHPGQWGYDFYQQAGYPPIATGHPSVSSPDNAAATPHNIRDILGGQQQQQQQGGETLVSEVAKTPSYQKSPTSAAAIGTVFHYPSPHHHYPQSIGPEVRSPTTPTQHSPHDLAAHGFYLPGRHFVGFDPTALSPDGMTLPGATGIIYPGQNPLQDPKAQGEDKSGGNKDNKKDNKKGRATFSGNQIDELEKAFQTTQYLTNSERSRIAERLSLSENQVKIWFQNRRTKCRRTAWKTPGMTSPTTTTAPPTVLSSDSTTTSSATQ